MELLLAALGNDRRLRIVRHLARSGEPTAQAQLRADLELRDGERSGLSRDMSRLVAAGLLEEVAQKRWIANITEDEVDQLLEHAAELDEQLQERRAQRAKERRRALRNGR
jgi:DNA-binding transcriptional ArsR family regulator